MGNLLCSRAARSSASDILPSFSHLQNRGKGGGGGTAAQGIGPRMAPTIWVSGAPIREPGARSVSSSSPERGEGGLQGTPGLGPGTAQMHGQQSPQHRRHWLRIRKGPSNPRKRSPQDAPMPRADLSTSDLAAAKVREMPWASDPCHSSPSSDHEEMMPLLGGGGEVKQRLIMVRRYPRETLGEDRDSSAAQAQERGACMKVGKMEVEQWT